MAVVGTHSSTARPPASNRTGGRGRRLCLLAIALLVALVGWLGLVYAAIRFGGQARDGDGTSWVWLGLAGVGAVTCLFGALLAGVRLVAVARGREAPRHGGGHRR